jgi:hypothetical protein
LRGLTELGPIGVQRENPDRGRSGDAYHHPVGEGVGPIRRIHNSNPEGYFGPNLGNSIRKGYRRCGRLSVMKDLVQAARGRSDLRMGLTVGGITVLRLSRTFGEAVGSRI